MKWRSLYTAGCLILAGLLTACSSGGGKTGTTAVTVTVGGGSAAHKAAYQPAIASKVMPAVASITFTVSGPGIDTVIRVVPITPPQTITEVFYILSGPSRNFLIEAKDGSDAVIYSGSVLANLDGEPLTLTLPLQTRIFDRLIWSPWGDEATAIARVGNGDLIVAGHTYGDLEGNVNADPSHGTTDVFVSRLTAAGARIWTKQFGTTGFDICYSVATDPSGNIYLAGSTAGALNGASQAGLGPINAYITKLSSTGAHLWTSLTGTTGANTFGNAVAVDSAGNAYVTGDTTGGLNGASAGLYDLFLAKYDAAGAHAWTRQLGTVADDFGESVAVDAAGTNIVVAGSTKGGLNGKNAGRTDIVLIRYDQGGTIQGTPLQMGTADDDSVRAVAFDPQGGVYIAGITAGDLVSAVAGTSPAATYAGLSDLFVAKLDASQSLSPMVWIRQLGTAGNDVASGITIDTNGGGVIVTGQTSGDMDGAGNAGFDDMVMVRYDLSGSLLETQQFGTKANDAGMGVVSDNNGHITVLGNTYGGFTSSATEDVFLKQYQYTPSVAQ